MRARSPLEAKILDVAEPVGADLGFAIVRVRLFGGAKRQRLQIMAERDDGTMSADDCAAFSRALSAVLDVEDPFRGEWELEISSPGIDRPLTAPAHFKRWEGFTAKIELDRLVEGRKRFSGILAGVEDEDVLIDLAGETDVTAAIPFAWIADAKLLLTDDLVAESLRARPEPPDAEADAGDVEIEDEETAR